MSNLKPRYTPTSYGEAVRILANRGRSRVVLCYATHLQDDASGPAIYHHGSRIIQYAPNGDITLYGYGWATRTTADRMHRFTPAWVRVNSRRARLGVEIDGRDIGDASLAPITVRPR